MSAPQGVIDKGFKQVNILAEVDTSKLTPSTHDFNNYTEYHIPPKTLAMAAGVSHISLLQPNQINIHPLDYAEHTPNHFGILLGHGTGSDFTPLYSPTNSVVLMPTDQKNRVQMHTYHTVHTPLNAFKGSEHPIVKTPEELKEAENQPEHYLGTRVNRWRNDPTQTEGYMDLMPPGSTSYGVGAQKSKSDGSVDNIVIPISNYKGRNSLHALFTNAKAKNFIDLEGDGIEQRSVNGVDSFIVPKPIHDTWKQEIKNKLTVATPFKDGLTLRVSSAGEQSGIPNKVKVPITIHRTPHPNTTGAPFTTLEDITRMDREHLGTTAVGKQDAPADTDFEITPLSEDED